MRAPPFGLRPGTSLNQTAQIDGAFTHFTAARTLESPSRRQRMAGACMSARRRRTGTCRSRSVFHGRKRRSADRVFDLFSGPCVNGHKTGSPVANTLRGSQKKALNGQLDPPSLNELAFPATHAMPSASAEMARHDPPHLGSRWQTNAKSGGLRTRQGNWKPHDPANSAEIGSNSCGAVRRSFTESSDNEGW
jgi:hypothetical protein